MTTPFPTQIDTTSTASTVTPFPLSAGSGGEDFGPVATPASSAPLVMLRDFLPGLLEDVLTGQPPPEYHFDAKPWGTLSLRPKQIVGIGGAPNCGKTGLALKMTTGALLMNPQLKAVYACVEMDEGILMERTLARLSGVYLGKILKRDRDSFFAERIKAARPQLESLADRLMFVRRPFTMLDVQAACEKFRPDLVVLDYLQRIHADQRLLETRQQVTEVMTRIRLLADRGLAVLLIAALNRQASGRAQARAKATNEDVNDLAAFRDASDIEYSVDDAYVLAKGKCEVPTADGDEYKPMEVFLRHVKSRNSLLMHIPLTFDGRLQEFTLRPWKDAAPEAFCGPGVLPKGGKTVGLPPDEAVKAYSELLKGDSGETNWL